MNFEFFFDVLTVLLVASALMPRFVQASENTVDAREPRATSGEYEIELSSVVQSLLGTFDPYGNYIAFPDGSQAWTWVTTVGGSYRFNPEWQVGLTCPFRMSSISFPTGSVSGEILGGPFFVIKYHLDTLLRPVFHAGVSLPLRAKSFSYAGDPLLPQGLRFGTRYCASAT